MNFTEQDKYYMQCAIELAKLAAQQGEVPVGAIIVQDQQIIGEGYNRPIALNDASAHAEIMAIRDASKKIENYRLPATTMYVTLEPCMMCLGALIHARIQRLVFGADDPKSGAVVSVFQVLEGDKLNHKIFYESGLLKEESSELLKRFFQVRRSHAN